VLSCKYVALKPPKNRQRPLTLEGNLHLKISHSRGALSSRQGRTKEEGQTGGPPQNESLNGPKHFEPSMKKLSLQTQKHQRSDGQTDRRGAATCFLPATVSLTAPEMPSSSSSSSSSLLLSLLLLLPLLPLLLRPAGAAEDAHCSGDFRSGQGDFVLDTEDAVKEGAALLATAHVHSAEGCERACCEDWRCNLALLEPRDPATDNRTCALFDCVHRNRFVCRFVNQVGYQSYIRQTVFLRYLQGPQGPDDKAPPIAIAGHDVITQPGETVTLDGIESLALGDARITAYRWSLLSGAGDVTMEKLQRILESMLILPQPAEEEEPLSGCLCDEKTDLPDQVRLTNLQPGSYVFQLTVTDSNDQSHADKVTVLVLSPELSSLYCLAPVKVGPCRAAFPRWRYNAVTGGCQQFVYGGCKQNNNNFLSEHECLSACRGVTATAERSGALPAGEVCGVVCRPDQMICSNSCCLDRSLECDGKKHCGDASDEEYCNASVHCSSSSSSPSSSSSSSVNSTLTHLLDIDVNQQKARCSEPPHTGPCRASHSRWYYFRPPGHPLEVFERFKKEEESDSVHSIVLELAGSDLTVSSSGNIALAVLLTVAILALLAILTYCFLKSRKKRSHRPVATGPSHVALSEQDTLVYNSTTKPL
ncbi:hypothetical protein L3Q82_011471, partial [Scortum barcoo]